MPVSVKSTDFVYFPAPKAACTSIKYGILNYNENGLADRMPVTLPNGKHIPHAHAFYRTAPLKPVHVLRYAGKRWFCVVRDPVKRFLSAYGNRVVHHDDLKHCEAALEQAGLSRHPDLGEFADRFEAYCRVSRVIDWHIRPLVDFLGRRPGRYDRVFRMSELGELPDYLRIGGAEITLPHRQAGGPKLKPDDLPAATLERIERYYAADYKTFGAWFD